jgi:rubrerythrin
MSKINKEGHSKSYKKLHETKTLDEILTIAISFEKTARDFYFNMISKVSKNIRYIVEELAEEEQQHFDLFSQLKNNPEVQKQLDERVKTPTEDHKFSDFVQLLDLGDNPDDQSILQYAVAREDAAMKQYQDLADNAPEGQLRDTFQFLALEEAEHKLELEKKYYELVHSGGPGN